MKRVFSKLNHRYLRHISATIHYINNCARVPQCSQTDNHEDNFAQIHFKMPTGVFFSLSVVLKFLHIIFEGFETSFDKKNVNGAKQNP